MTPGQRHTADTITDDDLDALYTRLEKAEAAEAGEDLSGYYAPDPPIGCALPAPDAGLRERRTRYAAAIRDRIKACTVPSLIPGQPPTSGATEHDIANAAMDVADVELRELRAELERLREQQAGHLAQMRAARQQTTRWWQRAQEAERAIERVQELAARWETALPGQPHHGFAEVLRAALDGQQQEAS